MVRSLAFLSWIIRVKFTSLRTLPGYLFLHSRLAGIEGGEHHFLDAELRHVAPSIEAADGGVEPVEEQALLGVELLLFQTSLL